LGRCSAHPLYLLYCSSQVRAEPAPIRLLSFPATLRGIQHLTIMSFRYSNASPCA
jgi:hypothetical protein